ncbi:MAG TPA: hypothetical protein VK196_02615 [Magnetospirillum sp.]|nr:hypothetical protein [Magnetospirillum sp.]
MKQAMIAIAVLATVAAGPTLAQTVQQDQRVPAGRELEPPGGAYQGYQETRNPPEQVAEVPGVPERGNRPHPGTLTKFNSNTGYGPEVEFEKERREAQQRELGR